MDKKFITMAPVAVITPEHPLHAKAGVVIDQPDNTPDRVKVRFDATPDHDFFEDTVAIDDLKVL